MQDFVVTAHVETRQGSLQSLFLHQFLRKGQKQKGFKSSILWPLVKNIHRPWLAASGLTPFVYITITWPCAF